MLELLIPAGFIIFILYAFYNILYKSKKEEKVAYIKNMLNSIPSFEVYKYILENNPSISKKDIEDYQAIKSKTYTLLQKADNVNYTINELNVEIYKIIDAYDKEKFIKISKLHLNAVIEIVQKKKPGIPRKDLEKFVELVGKNINDQIEFKLKAPYK